MTKLILPVLALALLPATANAGTLTATSDCKGDYDDCETHFVYTAAPGETNAVSATSSPVEISDSAPITIDTDYCAKVAEHVECASPSRGEYTSTDLTVDLGDGDDSATGDRYVYVDGGPGADRLTGVTADYTNAPAPVDADLNLRRATSGGDTDTFVRVRHVVGSAFDDVLRGTASADVLEGGPGNDRIYGRGGDDYLWGDAGRDRLDGGAGDDSVLPGDPSGSTDADRVTCGGGTDDVGARLLYQNYSDPIDVLASDCEFATTASTVRFVARPVVKKGSLTVRAGDGIGSGTLTVARADTGATIGSATVPDRHITHLSVKLSAAGRRWVAHHGKHAVRLTWSGEAGIQPAGWTTEVGS